MAITHIFSFLSFWLLQPPSSRHLPAESPEHVFCVLLGSVRPLWVSWHASFPACPSSHVGGLGAFRATQILPSVGSLPGDHSCLCLWFLSWSSWCEPERGGIMSCFLFWDMHRSQSRTRWLVHFLFIFRCKALFLVLRYKFTRVGRPWIKLWNIKNCIKTIALSSPWFLMKILVSIFWETTTY